MGELSRESTRQVLIRLTPAADDKLAELARGSGIAKARVAAAMLEELLPSVTGVRQRLQITRNGRADG